MKKYLFILTALLLAACSKEVPVTRDHPVSVDFEDTEPVATLSVVWASCPEGAVTGEVLNAAISASEADVILCTTDPSFEGGAEEWFDTHAPQWGQNVLASQSGGKYLCAATAEGISAETLDVGTRDVLVLKKGAFALVLGNIQESNVRPLLDATWFAGSGTDWIFALSLPDASPTLEDATFTDCLYGQFGPVAMAGSRSDYIYASAGVWSLLQGMAREQIGSGYLYRFTICAEESRL
ncbi:MAG: hypothetical protein IKP46_03410 [Bacteroidales bacterium]|nr:hypothetical protein [Bacteroidales bacterium]